MPELPEVETTRRGLLPHMVGRRIGAMVVRNASLRWPVPADRPFARALPASAANIARRPQLIENTITPKRARCVNEKGFISFAAGREQ